MTYVVNGLERRQFKTLFAMDDAALAALRARRVTADSDRGFPCRVSLDDAKAGESLILLHHTSHDVETPYRSSYAIYVRETAPQAGPYVDSTPPVFLNRPIALRGFGAQGNLLDARLALDGNADTAIRDLFSNAAIAYIHAHNAAHGCFAARIDRHGDEDEQR